MQRLRIREIAEGQHVRVEAGCVCLRNVEDGGRYRTARREACDHAVQHERLARLIDRTKPLSEGRACPVEGAADIVGCWKALYGQQPTTAKKRPTKVRLRLRHTL